MNPVGQVEAAALIGWMSELQRLEPVAPGSWVHGAWHEAVIGSPGSTAASMTGIEGAAVIQHDKPQVPHQIEVERQLLERLNTVSHSRHILCCFRRRKAATYRAVRGAGTGPVSVGAAEQAGAATARFLTGSPGEAQGV